MHFRFDSFAALSSEALLVVDMNTDRILHANALVQAVFGMPASTLDGAGIASIWRYVDPTELEALTAACTRSPAECRHERVVTVNHPESGVRKVRIRAFRSDLPSAETYILAEDITEKMRKAERQLQDALYRQDVMVREVHHRIKNNLQGVIGVLQSARIESDSARQAVNEAIHKINAIAEVNGMLTSSRSEVPINELVKRLSNYLSGAFSAAVSVDTQIPNPAFPPVSFNYDAVPIALVMNEIITNAIKYNDDDTAVHVSIKYDDDACEISIFNHGTLASQGLFESIAPNTHGLGLVKALLPPDSTRFSLMQSGDTVKATLWLDSTLIRR